MPLRPIILVGLVVSMVSGVVLGVSSFWVLQRVDQRLPSIDSGAGLVSVLRQVGASYVEDVDESKLVEDAIRGMLSGLDDHSAFLDKTEFEQLQEDTSGEFGGIGIEVGLVDGYITVITPIDDTPAAVAGMRPGDTLIELNHSTLKGRTLTDAVTELRGRPGSPVHLKVRREDAEQPIDFELIRDTIVVSSVKSRLLEPGYGYLRIAQFQNSTAEDVRAAVEKMLSAAEPLKGLVIDLRNNPGGVLRSSVAVADTFLKQGLIVYTEGRLPSSALRFTASGSDLLDGAPIVVLINQGSASASEIVAGALKDHGRAVLIGSKTYGKGSVQSVLPLRDDRAIKLTTALYYTPSGRSIHAQGIEPDIQIPETVRNDADYSELVLAEALRQLKSG